MIVMMTKFSAILGLAALLSTSLVIFTYEQTKDRIADQEKQQLLQQLNQVIPTDLHNNLLYENCTQVSDKQLGTQDKMPVYIATQDGKPTAMAVEAIAPDGYSGNIKILVGVDINNTVLGVRVLKHNETPGLGDKIELRISDWILSFSNKELDNEHDPSWFVQKDGGQFDQFTGATITPRAVVKAAKKAAWYLIKNKDALIRQPQDCGDIS